MEFSDWYRCPSCNLKHSSRPDMKCPRCGQPLRPIDILAEVDRQSGNITNSRPAPSPVSNPPRRQSTSSFGPSAPTDTTLARNVRIAGIIFILNAVLVFTTAVVSKSQILTPKQILAPVAIDFILGVYLACDNKKAHIWAIIRTALGGIIWPLSLYSQMDDSVSAFIQIIFSSSMLSLLLGKAGTLRLVISVVLAGMVLVFGAINTVGEISGYNPMSPTVMKMNGTISGSAVAQVTGRKASYELTFPDNRSWFLVNDYIATKDNPNIDLMVVRAVSDIYLVVIAEKLPSGANLDMDLFAKGVTKEVSGLMEEFEAKESEKLEHACPALFLRYSGKAKDSHLEFLSGLFHCNDVAYRVAVFSTPKNIEKMYDELLSIISSLDHHSE